MLLRRWQTALDRLTQAELVWIVTVRPDGRPHATPVVPVVRDAKVYFHVGRTEVKHANVSANPHALVPVGDTAWDDGLDVMVEGVAAPVTDDDALRPIAAVLADRRNAAAGVRPQHARAVPARATCRPARHRRAVPRGIRRVGAAVA